jgi:hypothetical protein
MYFNNFLLSKSLVRGGSEGSRAMLNCLKSTIKNFIRKTKGPLIGFGILHSSINVHFVSLGTRAGVTFLLVWPVYSGRYDGF